MCIALVLPERFATTECSKQTLNMDPGSGAEAETEGSMLDNWMADSVFKHTRIASYEAS
jgi:hypothetical protein